MWWDVFRRRPPLPPPEPNPVVESWLSGIPADKPTTEQLRQLDLEGRTPSWRHAFLTGVILRSVSLVIAIVVVILTIVIRIEQEQGFLYFAPTNLARESVVIALVTGLLIFVWNTAEFFVICARQGHGIAPAIHVCADGVLALGAALSTALLVAETVTLLYDSFYTASEKAKDIVASLLLLVLALIHSFLFFFHCCAIVGRRKKANLEPRVRNYWTERRLAARERVARDAATERTNIELAQPQRVVPAVDQDNDTDQPARLLSVHEPVRLGVPPRRPVAGTVGTHYAMPWPSADDQPGDWEQARADRGETQPQWMTLRGMQEKGQDRGLGAGTGINQRGDWI